MQNSSKRCVVVGGLGFLGAAVVDALLDADDSVCVVDLRGSQGACDRRFGRGRVTARRANILEPDTLARAVAGCDEVYNFAGRLGTSELLDDIRGAVAANITGAVNVFETAAAAGVPVVFHASKPNVWLNAYTITKAAADDFGRLFADLHGLRVRSLRYFNAYGPGQAIGPVRKIIPAFTLQALRGEPLTIYGDGRQTVDMIYSADIGRITVEFARAQSAEDIVDCGRGVALTVNDVAAAVNAVVGNEAGVEYVPMRRGESPTTDLVADIEPLRRAIGDPRFADWEHSLRATVEWYRVRWPDGNAGVSGRSAAGA